MLDRRRLIASAAALAVPTIAAARPLEAEKVDVEAIRAESGVPALAGVVSDTDGLVAQFASGVRRAGASEPVTLDDRWHIGSNTKAMTAALFARMVEADRGAWSSTLPSLFPDLKLDPAWSQITLEQLMAHRAGISDAPVMGQGWMMRAHGDTRPLDLQRTEIASRVLGAPPTGKPGVFEYGNLNFILAGAAIERLSGMSWERTIQERLFSPLGVTSAGFGAPKGVAPWGHVAAGGDFRGIDPAGPSDNPPVLGPAGTLHMTLADHARFARLFLKPTSLLTPDSVRRLSTPFPAADPPAYGMGWMVLGSRPWSHGDVLAHEGSNTFWHEVVIIAPARGVAIITVCNAGREASKQAAVRLAQGLQKAYAA